MRRGGGQLKSLLKFIEHTNIFEILNTMLAWRVLFLADQLFGLIECKLTLIEKGHCAKYI